MKCSSVIFLSVDLVSSSWERGAVGNVRELNSLAPSHCPSGSLALCCPRYLTKSRLWSLKPYTAPRLLLFM